MFHLQFTKKLSARLQVNRSVTKLNKLEVFLKPQLENYICDCLINTDRQTIKWFTNQGHRSQHPSQLLIENKLSLLPIICKYGAQKHSIENSSHNEIYVIKLD